jgi:hypothetical protein
LPWCLLSRMIFVVAGPTRAKFAKPAVKTVSIGRKTLSRFSRAKTPDNPGFRSPIAVRSPGYVSPMRIGRAVCSEKYTGKSDCCRDEN